MLYAAGNVKINVCLSQTLLSEAAYSAADVERPEARVARADGSTTGVDNPPYRLGRPNESAGDAGDGQILKPLGHLKKRDAWQHLDGVGFGTLDHMQPAVNRAAVLKEQAND